MGEIIAVFGVDWRLLLIQAVNFGLLLLVLWYFLYRPVVKMIGKRQEKITQGVHAAEQAEKEFQRTEEKRRQILTRASAEAEETLQSAISHAKARETEILEEARKRSEEALSDAKAKAEEHKRRMLEESREEIARMVVLGVEKVLRKKA